MNKRHTIIIIGAGASGTLVAAHLLRQTQLPLHIFLIESRPLVGRGAAYSTTNKVHLLNVPAGKMSAYPDIPEHFVRWLTTHSALAEDGEVSDTATFAPRMLYGVYLQDVLMQVERTSVHGTLEIIHDEAITVQPTAAGGMVTLRSGRWLQADAIVFATGNPTPRDPFVETPAFYTSPRYRRNPWSANAISTIASDATVLLLGSGLTMVDVAIALQAQGHIGPVLALSRRGLSPHAHTLLPHTATQQAAPNLPSYVTPRFLLRWLRTQVASHPTNDWRCVVDSLRHHGNAIWQAWSLTEKQQFLRHIQPHWDVRRHRIAPIVGAQLARMQTTGQLNIRAGRVQRYDETEQDVRVTIRWRQAHEATHVFAQHVINCTGPNGDVTRSENALLKGALAQGLLRTDALRLGVDVTSDGAVVQQNEHPSPFLYALGPVCKGTLWETTAVPEIRVQAQQLARYLLTRV